MEEILKKELETNETLLRFCRRIVMLKQIFKEESTRSLFFGSLISADTLLTKEDCANSIETGKFIIFNIDLFELDAVLETEILTKARNVVEIATLDFENFIKDEISVSRHRRSS